MRTLSTYELQAKLTFRLVMRYMNSPSTSATYSEESNDTFTCYIVKRL